MSTSEVPPSDYQYFSMGMYYKIGRFDFLYVWLNNEWVRSTKPLREVENSFYSRHREMGNNARERRNDKRRRKGGAS